jgi:hypothetical protein
MARKNLFYLRGIYAGNHFAEVYSDTRENIIELNLETDNKISRVRKAEINIDYGGSIIMADPLEVTLNRDYSLFIRKESFHLFADAVTKEGFFDKVRNFSAFHCRSPLVTFAYIPEDIIEKILTYDFQQHFPEINEHLDLFNEAMADIEVHYAKEKQRYALSKISEDLKNNKCNKKLN